MFQDSKKFNREIKAIKSLEAFEQSELHPLIKENIKQRVLKSLSEEPAVLPKSLSWSEKKTYYIKYLVSSLLGFSMLAGTAFAANNSKPGDILFPVKKVEEKIAVSLAVSPAAKASLEVKFAERRLEELKQIQAEIKIDEPKNTEAASATSTEPNKNDNNNDNRAKKSKNSQRHLEQHTKAEQEAQAEVSNAINALIKAQEKLDVKNNQQAASSVQSTLLKLKDSENEFKFKRKDGQGEVKSATDERKIKGAGQDKIPEDQSSNDKRDIEFRIDSKTRFQKQRLNNNSENKQD